LQFRSGESVATLGLDGTETFDIAGLAGGPTPRQDVEVVARDADGGETRFAVTVRIDAAAEVEYYQHGGILQMVLREMLRG
jgi:aconitate hydratase